MVKRLLLKWLMLLAVAGGLSSIASAQLANAWAGNETHSGREIFNGAVAINSPFTSASSGPSPWIDVTSAPYGAVCDGVTNDTTAIQNALNAANTIPGTVLFLLGKTCAVSSLTLDGFGGVTVRGGWGAALPPGNVQATIKFTGACSSSACLSIRSAGAINFYDIALMFPNAATGPMVDLSRSSLGTDSQLIGFHGVSFQGPGITIGPIVLDQNTDAISFDNWTQFHNASVFVEGPATNSSGSGFSDASVFNQVQMSNWGTSAIQNASVNWSFSNIIAESKNPSSCVPFLQYINGFSNEHALSIDSGVFSPGENACSNAYIFISVPPVSGNAGGLSFRNNLVLPNSGSTTGTALSIGNGQNFSSYGNLFQNIATVYSIGTGITANIGPNRMTGISTFLIGAPAGGSVLDNTGRTTIYDLRVGGGSTISSIFHAVGLPLNSAFTSIAAGSCQEQTLTLTGITTKGVSTANPESSLGGNFSWSSWISSANTITVHVCAGSTATPNSVLWNVSVID